MHQPAIGTLQRFAAVGDVVPTALIRRIRLVAAMATLPWCLVAFSSVAAHATDACPTPPGSAREGGVRYFIADLKTSFPEHWLYSQSSGLDASNYKLVLQRLRAELGVNGVRVPIIPSNRSVSQYSGLYRSTVQEARALGMLIYASPMSVGMKSYTGWTSDQYARWIVDYANAFQPDVVSVFNESGMDANTMLDITNRVRGGLRAASKLAGPDKVHVAGSLQALNDQADLSQAFDVIDSHNANRDMSATAAGWAQLRQAAGPTRSMWSSENPAGWNAGRGGAPGIEDAVSGGVDAVVIWQAVPSLISNTGQVTPSGCQIGSHIGLPQ